MDQPYLESSCLQARAWKNVVKFCKISSIARKNWYHIMVLRGKVKLKMIESLLNNRFLNLFHIICSWMSKMPNWMSLLNQLLLPFETSSSLLGFELHKRYLFWQFSWFLIFLLNLTGKPKCLESITKWCAKC